MITQKINRFCIPFKMCLVFGMVSFGVKAQKLDSIPPPVLSFYENALGIDELNPRAPKETLQFGQLAGIWHCTGSEVDPETGEMNVVSSAFWAWKYILDGYGVQDYWYQGENESRYWKFFKRDLMLTQLRIYDVPEEKWKIAFINNHAGEVPGRMFGLFTATQVGEDMVMEFEPQDPENLRKITFYSIQKDSFEWKVESSTNGGEKWFTTSHISAKRIK